MAGQALQTDPAQRREAFFERVLQQHATLLYRVAYSVLRHPADAEDAVADALLKLLRSGAWERIDNERAFLTRSVWRSALDCLQERTPGGTAVEEAPPLVDPGPSPLRHSVANQQWRRLHDGIDALPPELRQPLLLSAVEELTSREIGEIMHLPEGTVRTRLMRARALLRQQFEPYNKGSELQEPVLRGIAQ